MVVFHHLGGPVGVYARQATYRSVGYATVLLVAEEYCSDRISGRGTPQYAFTF